MSGITQWDLQILMWLQENVRTDWLTPVMKGVSFLGDGGWFFILFAIVLTVNKKTRRTGWICVANLALAILCCNVILKPLIARVRPYDLYAPLIPLGHENDFSFPSGHTNCAFAVAFVLMRAWRSGKERVIAWCMLVLSVLIAFSRLYLGVHYPTDVIAGILLPYLTMQVVWYFLVRKGLLDQWTAKAAKKREARKNKEV